MIKKITAIFSLIFLFVSSSIFAETIVLKSGKTIEGKMLEKTDKYARVDIDGVPVTYYLEEILSIENISSNESLPSGSQTTATAQGFSREFTNDTQVLKIPISPMIELDLKTKAEIYEIRKQAVLRYAQLAPKEYRPSDEIFGQIEDGKYWWGMVGQSFFGPGEKSVVGYSEESRFLINPFLLVGLADVGAYAIDDKSLSPQANYPVPINLVWNNSEAKAMVTYELTNYWKVAKRYHYQSADTHAFDLIAYNARDLGFNYLYVVPEKSKNVSVGHSAPVLIRQYIHCGGSCGHSGGCNNMSPEQKELEIVVDQVPATLYIKLWKSNPSNGEQSADVVFIVEMI